MKHLERRLNALERRTSGPSMVCVLRKDHEAQEDALARWERDNGPIGERQVILVTLVDAAL